MSEMIERLARVLAEELSGSPNYVEAENLSSATIDGCFDLNAVARAAIVAMREPTEGMVEAARLALIEWHGGSEGFREGALSVLAAALGEEAKP